MIPSGILKSIFGFLWRFKLPILILVLCGLVYMQRGTITDLKADKKQLQDANAAFATTLKTVRESTAAQIKALQTESAAAADRQQQLEQILEGVYSNDETVNCPVPDFVRNAFERM